MTLQVKSGLDDSALYRYTHGGCFFYLAAILAKDYGYQFCHSLTCSAFTESRIL